MSPPPAPDALGHRSVLGSVAAEALVTRPDGTYVDATFGRGGHSRLILAQLAPAARLIAFDRDPEAVAAAAAISDARFSIEHAPFSQMQERLAARGIAQVDGILMDIGVSSPQIDDPARGFSFRSDGPLDMRMDTSRGPTAAQWLAQASVDELKRVIADYGEERFALSIAKAIAARRSRGPVETTSELAAVVADAVPRNRRDPTQHPATRTFQAVRIHLNQELEELALALDQAGRLLAPGARLAVISFHSLEDRAVKRFLAAHAHPERALDARLPLRAGELPAPRFVQVRRVLPDAAECAANPRARSAVMRVAERSAAPWPAGGGAA
jgi:16S rRNA (cytosine1402-N4)-methyltransferase